ncbi:MAG: GNAT family N-acetyltransferase [Gammaproteobacteria bacterium]|nr:GNAT family N-acetyltransferase [Gammaproteobacteria bacterium]
MTSEIMATDRLTLRSVCDSDLDRLHRITFSDPKVMSHAFAGKTFSRLESTHFFKNYFDHDGNGKQIGVLVLNGPGTIIGFAGLVECPVLGRKDYEIGFVLARKYWGKGYASEIGIAQIEYGIESAGCQRLLALVSPGNTASKSVLNKIGMIHHSTIEAETRGIRDIYVTQSQT